MLHKSFKPAKCKTVLKLAASRIKLLKNKREAQIKQLKRELAQLLESGQDQTARIRVEHVVREEKTMAAYELIEIYCELVATRLPIIESQKNCPIDLKEAIASLIFASPRCADVPELMDIRKHLTAKYGKEFASAAVELRPDCGVSRLLVEKLSAKAPDGPTKIKILSAIADEHNIKWEPKSFEEKDNQAPDDLLNGPNNFEQASNIFVEHPNVQEPMNSINQSSLNFPVPSGKQDISSNSYGLRQSSHFEDFPPSDIGTENSMPSGNTPLYVRHSESQVERMESRNPNQDGSVPPSSRPSWPMEFKDATSAAQAAAEAAERASVAARAAAELSSQGRSSRPHSGESQEASNFASRDQRHKDYPAKSNFPANSARQDDNGDGEEQDNLAGLVARFHNLKNSNSASALASTNSSGVSVKDNSSVDNPQTANSSSQYSLYESERSQFPDKAAGVTRESSQSELNFVRPGDGLNSDYVDSFNELKQHDSNSSHSHSRRIIEDPIRLSSFDNDQSGEEIENPFAMGEERIVRSADGISSYDRVTAVFDDSGSEEGENAIDFEGEHTVCQSGSYFSSEVRQPFSHLFSDKNSFSSSNNMDEPGDKFKSASTFASDKSSTWFSEGLKSEEVTSHSDGLLPVAFDDSDGPSSESEELPKPGHVLNGGSDDFLQKETFGFRSTALNEDDHSTFERGNVDSGSTTSSFDLTVSTSKQELGVSKDIHSSSLGTNHPSSSRPLKSGLDNEDLGNNLQVSGISLIKDGGQRNELLDVVDNEDSVNNSMLESGTELNFGVLAGGLRNKGYRFPPYRRKTSDISSDSKEAAEVKISRMIDQSSSSLEDNLSEIHNKKDYGQVQRSKANKMESSEATVAYSDSSDDHSDDEGPHQTVSITQATYRQRTGVKVSGKSSSRTFFDSDDNASDEDYSKSNITGKTRLDTGFSRRTKASQGTSVRSSHKNSKVLSESLTNADGTQEAKSPRSSFTGKAQAEPWPLTRITDDNKSSERRSGEQAASRKVSPFKSSSHIESSSEMSSVPDILLHPPSQSKISDHTGNEKQLRSYEEAGSKAIPKSKRTSHKERLKSSAREQSSNSSNLATSGSAGSPANSSSQGETLSKENSITRESHVHPKLPDYDTFSAQLMALRQNRP